MINTSSDYKAQVLKDGCQWKALAEITYHDGAVASISNEDIMENGISFLDGTSQKDKFCVGSFVSKMITLKLCNFEGKFTEDRFQGAQIHLKLGLFIESTQLWEWIDLGTFYVDKHPSSGGVITLTAYNDTVNFEKKYDSTLTYPATLAEILQDACTNCGVALYSTTFPNSDYVVTTRPSDDATTYADIVSDVAQLSACFAKCNNLGQLVLDWYDLDRFYPESGDTVDGGDFSSYSQADSIDGGPFYPSAPAMDGGSFADYADDDTYNGGGFTDYSEADALDGGNFIGYGATPSDIISGGVFRKNLLTPARIASLTSYEIASKDIRITGVQIVPMDKNKPTLKKGVDGYVISIEKNPLAQDNLDALVNFLAYRLIDFSFRPMQATGWDDPSYEAGDVAILTDPYGNQYQTIISNLEYTFGDYESYSADAESESENQSVNFSEGAKAVQEARDDTVRQITAYDQAVGAFTSMAALAMGLYSTKKQLDDGSFILYWHDKPSLTDSKTIWKLTQNVFVVSDDGGSSWRGMDKDGNILAKVLNVIGINADWINAGTIKVGGLTGKSIVSLSDDGNMRCVQNGADGFVIQQKVGSSWVTTWQADSKSGKTIAYNLNHTQKVEMGGDVGYRTYLWNNGWMLTGGQGADGSTGVSKIFNPDAPDDYGIIGATPEGNIGLALYHNGAVFCRLLASGGGENSTGFVTLLSDGSYCFGANTDGNTYMKYESGGTPSQVVCGDGLINFNIGEKVCGAVGPGGVQANTVSGDLPCKGATGYGDFTLHIDRGVITGWDNR